MPTREAPAYVESRVRQDPGEVRRVTGSDREVTLLASLAIFDAVTEQMNKSRLTAREYAVMTAVLHYTVRYQRHLYGAPLKCSHAYLSSFAHIARNHVGPTLRKLHMKGFVRYAPGSAKQSEDGHSQTHSRVSLVVPEGWERHLPKQDEVGLVPHEAAVRRAGDAAPALPLVLPDDQGSHLRTPVTGQESQVGTTEGSQLGTSDGPKLGASMVPTWAGQESQVGTINGPKRGYLLGETKDGETNRGGYSCQETKASPPFPAAASAAAVDAAAPTSREEDSIFGPGPRASLDLTPQPTWSQVRSDPKKFLSTVVQERGNTSFRRAFSVSRQDEVLHALEEEPDIAPLSTRVHVWLLGHWMGYKQGRNANHAAEHFLRALRDFPPEEIEASLKGQEPYEVLSIGIECGVELHKQRGA